MTVEQVIWTALPNGFDEEGRLLVSVHVAPRLTTDDGTTDQRSLGEFDAFQDWPARLADIHFDLDFDGQVLGGIPLQEPDSTLWRILFPDGMAVTPHRFTDHAKRNIHVFPVRDVLAFLESTYAALSAAGPDLPSIDDPGGPLIAFGPLGGLSVKVGDSNSFWEEIGRAHEKAGGLEEADLPDGKVVYESIASPGLPADQQAAQNAMFQALRFYYRPGSQRPDFPPDYVEPPPEVPSFDFHEIVSLLADHPALLRRLGLIIDLAVDLPEPVGHLDPTGVVRVMPHGALPEEPARNPGTHYELDDRWFGARPEYEHLLKSGLVNLTPEFWDMLQVDVDGGALQAVQFGDTLASLRDPATRNEETPADTGAPALRSAGLAMARAGRGEALLGDLLDRRVDNKAVETHHPVDFYAEDLVRGYRLDIWDQDAPSGQRWFSLHERVTDHVVDGLSEPLDPVEDEGFVKATSASSEREDHPAPSDDLYLHETVVAWDGWSLAAPRPGKRIVEPGEGDNGTSVAAYDPSVGQVLPIVSNVRVAKGTLPRLRVGHTYRMRIRTVDLCGNSRHFSSDDLEPDDPDLVSEAQMYLRFEPVPSPTVLRRALDTEGESLEHLVIRSNVGMTAAEYASSEEVKSALAGKPHEYSADSQRHLSPPKGSLQMAELDGRLDSAFGGASTGQMNAALRLALREEGTFLDPEIVDPATGQKSIAQTQISFFPAEATFPPERGAPLSSTEPGQTEAPPGAYAYYPTDAVLLPYLPDPLAIGVALTGYDFAGNEVLYQAAHFPADWPKLEPFRLRLSEGPLSIAFEQGVLEVRVPPAEVIYARLSSVFPRDRLDEFAIWQWTPEAERTKELTAAAIEGRHWMLTPFRRLTLTHAVQQPLAVPDMTKLISSRSLGSTFAEFRGPILCHAPSTGHLDVIGEWTEDVDLLTDDAPRMRATGNEELHSALAFGFDLTSGEDAAEVSKPGSVAQPPGVPLPTAARVARHELGDTKYRRITYHSVATTRFRDFLPESIANGDPLNIQRVEETEVNDTPNAKLIHDIKSSARPAAPEVVQVLPTFRWERQDEGPVRTHVRRGKAVRVWLRRPWFSSGDGELLGVVLAPATKVPGIWQAQATAGFETMAQVSHARGGEAVTRWRPGMFTRSMETRTEFADLTLAAGVVGDLEATVAGTFTKAPTPAEIRKMLDPYVTRWGSDPVWQSRLPDVVPTAGDFPRRAASMHGLTLEEVSVSAHVSVAAHEVYFDGDRKLWYCDIELEMGDAYYPFVRLALARFQPQSLPGVHLSRVTMSDFMQVAPDRTAELTTTRTGFGLTVRGYAGRNVVGDLDGGLPAQLAGSAPRPNTTMRAAIEARPPGVPGDLGWKRVGSEVALHASVSAGFKVTWTGSLSVPAGVPAGHARRILLTEIETFPRDPTEQEFVSHVWRGDPVRERIVYADTFDIA
jgi:hypothetical protein